MEDFPNRFRNCAVSIGKFDGPHLGHVAILRALVSRAKELDAPSVVFTFDPFPAQILRPSASFRALCDVDQKIERLAALGVDALVLFPTTREFLQTSAREFFNDVLLERLSAVALVEGNNFHFGSDGGSVDVLAELCLNGGVALKIVEPVVVQGARVSSSRARALVGTGEVEAIRALLGRPYELRGIVERGDRRGRTLGFPTANLGSVVALVPSPGVYAAIAATPDGIERPAAVNVGGNPTFGIDATKIEAHLLGFQGDLYDRPLRLAFLEKIRDVARFESKDALVAQMARDLRAVDAAFQRERTANFASSK